jgi:3-methyl-2-oxobutanoate hydroxymethyltransferase
MTENKQSKPMTVLELQKMKLESRKITMLTAYDATFARLLDSSGVDVLLVGDSLGMVVQGKANTLSVTVDQMVYHGAAVSSVTKRAHVAVDMPFMSYHISPEEAVRNAGRLVAEGGAHSVKLEGGKERATTIRAIVDAQIPVMGHVGLTPQSFHAQGGFRIQGRTEEAGQRVLEDALAVQQAGAWCVVLEGIPAPLAAEISAQLSIPTIGIGAGNGCDGQVLVIYDLLGMDEEFQPKFVRRYAEAGRLVRNAVGNYIEEVRSGSFPGEENSFKAATKKRQHVTEAPQSSGGYGPSDTSAA